MITPERPGSLPSLRSGDDRPDRDPLTSGWLSAAFLALLCWVSFFRGLGALGLTDKTEALFVEVGRQMLLRGDWVTSWWNGSHFFDYPVWGYWMVALSFRLFGVSAWAARLPVALAASAVVVATFLLLRQWAQPGESQRSRVARAAVAAGVLATTPGWIGWGRTSTTDMFLASAITLSLYGFLLAERHGGSGWQGRLGRVAMAVFSGIAVLAKGPVGLLLPGLVVAAFLVLSRRWRPWLRPGRLLAMAVLFLGVCAPWYAAAARANGMAFLWGFLGFSNLQRFTSVLYQHPGPPWFYLPWLVVLLLPWSLFLPAAFARLRLGQRRSGPNKPAAALPAPDPLLLFLSLWLALMVAFFSAAATKLPGYILPALPAGSLLVALVFRPLPPVPGATGTGRTLLTGGWLNGLLLAAMAVAAALAPGWAATDPAYPDFASALRASGLPTMLSLLLAATALAVLVLLLRGQVRWLWLPNLAGFLAILALVVAPLAPLLDRERQLPLRQLAEQARQTARADEPLWVVGTKRYSIVFYSGSEAVFVSDRAGIDVRWRNAPALLRIKPQTPSVRLLGDRRHLGELGIPPGSIQLLARRGEQELWRVRRQDLEPRGAMR